MSYVLGVGRVGKRAGLVVDELGDPLFAEPDEGGAADDGRAVELDSIDARGETRGKGY